MSKRSEGPRSSTSPRPPRGHGGGRAQQTAGDGVKNPYVRFRKLERPPLEPALTTLWSYPSQHYGRGEQGSSSYRGATPSWVIWQVLERFTARGEIVVDPFCGSGTTLDVCRDIGRAGFGFDIAPARGDIERADARRLPLEADKAALAFLDPPYADNLRYSDAPECIGKTRAQDGTYFAAMAAVFDEMFRILRPGGHLAVYVQDILQARGGGRPAEFWPLGLELASLARRKFTMVDHVSVVRRNKDLERGAYRKAAAEGGFWLRGFNHLLIFRKTQTQRPPRNPETGRGGRPAARGGARKRRGG